MKGKGEDARERQNQEENRVWGLRGKLKCSDKAKTTTLRRPSKEDRLQLGTEEPAVSCAQSAPKLDYSNRNEEDCRFG